MLLAFITLYIELVGLIITGGCVISPLLVPLRLAADT